MNFIPQVIAQYQLRLDRLTNEIRRLRSENLALRVQKSRGRKNNPDPVAAQVPEKLLKLNPYIQRAATEYCVAESLFIDAAAFEFQDAPDLDLWGVARLNGEVTEAKVQAAELHALLRKGQHTQKLTKYLGSRDGYVAEIVSHVILVLPGYQRNSACSSSRK